MGSEVSKSQAILSSLSPLSCGSRCELSATAPATMPSICHHDPYPLEPQSQINSSVSSLVMVFHHSRRKVTNTVGLSKRSQHVCILIPKSRRLLRSFPVSPPCLLRPRTLPLLSCLFRILSSVSGSQTSLAFGDTKTFESEILEVLPDASLWLP